MPAVQAPVAAATVNTGFSTTTQTDILVRQVLTPVLEVYPVDPWMVWLNKMAKSNDGRNPTLEFMSVSQYPQFVTVNEAIAASGDTSLVLVSNSGLTVDTILQDEATGEQIVVTAVNADGVTVTIATRGTYGGGAPQALAVGKQLKILSVGRVEGADAISAIGIQRRLDSNYFQQFEQVKKITDLALNTLVYGQQVADFETRHAVQEYNKRRAKQFLFGYRASVSTAAGQRRIAGGMRDFCETADSIADAGGAFTYSELVDFMATPCRVGQGKHKQFIGLAGYGVMNLITKWSLERHQANHMMVKDYGFEILQIHGPGWTINLARSEAFEDGEKYINDLYIIRPEYTELHVYRGLAMTIHKMIHGPQKDGSHSIQDQMTSTETLANRMPEAHLIIENITS